MTLKLRGRIILNWISTERMETWPDSADSGFGKVTDSYGYGNNSHHIKRAKFLDQLSDYWHLKQSTTMNSAHVTTGRDN